MEAIKEFFKPVIDDFNLIKGKFLSYTAELRKVITLISVAYFSIIMAAFNFSERGIGYTLCIIAAIVTFIMARNSYRTILKDGGEKITWLFIMVKYFLPMYLGIFLLALVAKIILLPPGFIVYVVMFILFTPLAVLLYKKEKEREDL